MTTQATDRTALRERLIATIEHRQDWGAERIADAILTKFPEIGQQPQTTLHVPASDLPPNFTPSDTHIRAGLVDIGQQPKHDWPVGEHGHKFSGSEPPRQQQPIDPALRVRIETAVINYRVSGKITDRDKVMALIDSIAPAAQSQIDREALAKLIQEGLRRDMNLGSTSALDCADYVIAHLNAAPAAQPQIDREDIARVAFDEWEQQVGAEMFWDSDGPVTAPTPEMRQQWRDIAGKIVEHLNAVPTAQQLPTRSELANVLDAGRTKKWDHFVSKLIAAGYARENEPEPQVGDVDGNDLAHLCNRILAMDDLALGAWMDNADAYQVRALAKAVSEGGGS